MGMQTWKILDRRPICLLSVFKDLVVSIQQGSRNTQHPQLSVIPREYPSVFRKSMKYKQRLRGKGKEGGEKERNERKNTNGRRLLGNGILR